MKPNIPEACPALIQKMYPCILKMKPHPTRNLNHGDPAGVILQYPSTGRI
jgi:hypothetical protein